MAIDLITGHQGVSHISADQIATINNAMMDNFGANKVMRLVGGELTADGLTITISEGYWRVNGFDMEIQEGETLYIDPTTIGLSRIDDIYVEILQDIPTGAQRAEIYIALGEPSATPTAPDEPTAPYLNTDILLQIIKLARVTVSEGAMIMEDYSVAYNIVTPEDLVMSYKLNGYVGAKNLIPYPYYETTRTSKGITFTDNGDGTINVNGTSTGSTNFSLSPETYDDSIILPIGTYILTGCPSTGSGSTYRLRVVSNTNGARGMVGADTGQGLIFSVTNSTVRYEIKLDIVNSGISINNLVFKPMIRRIEDTDPTWQPYAKTNKELTDAFTNQVANSDDAYSPSKAYKVGEHCIYNNVVYKCITACSAAAWSVNQNCFETTTLTAAVTELNSDLNSKTIKTATLNQTASNIAVGGYASLSYDVSSLGNIVSATPIVKYTTWCLVVIETVSSGNTISVRVRNMNPSQSTTAEVQLLIAYK